MPHGGPLQYSEIRPGTPAGHRHRRGAGACRAAWPEWGSAAPKEASPGPAGTLPPRSGAQPRRYLPVRGPAGLIFGASMTIEVRRWAKPPRLAAAGSVVACLGAAGPDPRRSAE